MAAATDPPQPSPQTTQKVSEIVKSYRASRIFSAGSKQDAPDVNFTSLDFDDQGDFLVAAADDETMHIFDVKEGKRTKTVPSKKYGVHLARFTHHSRQILYASTRIDDSLRLLELHNESYVRYFQGHKDQVTCVALSPGSDAFLSCSRDNTVCLWDLNSRNPQGKLQLMTPYLAAFDPSASVIAIASQSTASVLMYDVRNYDKAPFVTFDLAAHEDAYRPSSKGRAWTRLEFSNDGKSLLVGTDYQGHFLLDAFEGEIKAFLVGKTGSTGRAAPVSTSGKPLGQGDVCFTPDGRFVLGSAGEKLETLVWDSYQPPEPGTKLLYPAATLPHKESSVIIECNPRYNMFASADKKVSFWLPNEQAKAAEND